MKSMKNSKILNNYFVEFKSNEEIYFPSVCVICGAETENRFKKNEYGSYIGGRDIKKDYSFNIPVCEDCNSKVNLKTGIANKSGKLLLFSCFLGVTLSILFYILIYSVIFSICILSILILFAYLNYQKKIKDKISLNNYFQVNLKNYTDTVELTFANKKYGEFVEKINLEKNKSKEQQIEEEKQKKEEISKEKNKIKKEDAQVAVNISSPKSTDQSRDSNVLIQNNIEVIQKTKKVLNASDSIAKNNDVRELNNDKVRVVIQCSACGHKSDTKMKICDNCGKVI